MTESLQTQLDKGIQLLQAGQLDEATRLAESLQQQHPNNPEVCLFSADAASMGGNHKAAIAYLKALPQTRAGSARVLLRIAQILFSDRQREASLEAARTAAKVIEFDEKQLRAVARIYSDCQDLDGARQWLLEAQQKLPQSVRILFDLAVTEFQLNLPLEAEQHIEKLLQLASFHPGALHLRSALKTQTSEHNYVDDLVERLARGPQQANFVTAANFALAKDYEDLGQYEASFAALEQGARARRGTLDYDSAKELAAHEHIRTGFTPDAFSSLGPGCESKGPLFIVGMPRTGTTLVERLLSSHSQVSSAGELRDFPSILTNLAQHRQEELSAAGSEADPYLSLDFGELGKRYIAAARQLAGGSPYFVDKLPYNFLYCGYIAAALPNARLIHLTRDPRDTCYALYKTLFFGAYSYSYDLAELADYFVSYYRQMQHWHRVLPGQILDVSYEQLVQNPKDQARKILEWCGLPWEEVVLDFHNQDTPSMTASAMQVRKPMSSDSIGSWQRAGDGFKPVLKRLLDEGLIQP